ncbi:MAG: hypothetical protein JNJ69_10885 [Leptospiraceae bacterium]|nr:hypothetical protein [Leptospiraceae bacterium]
MNYPVKVKKVFNRIRYQAHDVWQNLRLLKKNITCLVRNIDDMGMCVMRSRQIVQGLGANDGSRK